MGANHDQKTCLVKMIECANEGGSLIQKQCSTLPAQLAGYTESGFNCDRLENICSLLTAALDQLASVHSKAVIKIRTQNREDPAAILCHRILSAWAAHH